MNAKIAPPPLLQQAIRFAIVGSVGTLVQYSILALMVEVGHAPPLAGSSVGFIVAVIVAYFLNRRFTFGGVQRLGASFAKFVSVYAVGFALNGAIMQSLMHWGWQYLAAQAGAIAIVLVWNFLGSRFFAFR